MKSDSVPVGISMHQAVDIAGRSFHLDRCSSHQDIVIENADRSAIVDLHNDRVGVDCAFNKAGIVHAPQSIAQLDASIFNRVISVDLRGVFLCMKYELREMGRAGR